MQGYASTKNTIKNLHQGTHQEIFWPYLSLSLSLPPPLLQQLLHWKSLIFLCQVVGTFIIVIKHWKMQHFLDLLKLKYKLTKFSIYDDVWLKHNPVLRVWNQDLVKKHSGNTQLQVIYIYLQNPEVWCTSPCEGLGVFSLSQFNSK